MDPSALRASWEASFRLEDRSFRACVRQGS
jgi:hypothetical protein